ncbi:ABC transporter ATP-binding protein [Flavitalea sp. BT771]|uniref:ABC transporter ATP-binding protein n=1 Tax=Flavitalea sp. BT771 TaxID=3063329 RepID=UPI0026E466EA|nr:ABC transporter ATP-binding protein [Flavitalea sp. BT771]MDO6429228.1 ABC transporter ATP-binding protein [Flavitalea sp. BT771]MDV6218644.1 ABC transporter ATP-binding protein [Flavitalea sp. BT771]
MPSLLSIRDLTIDFRTEAGISPGVQAIHLEVEKGEIVALVGESGSGKSITSLSILQLLPMPPAHIRSGQILFTTREGVVIDLLRQDHRSMQNIRGNEIAMIFQEPMTSLNPVFSCGHQVAEAIRVHQQVSGDSARRQAIQLFEKVRLPDPAGIYSRYPHELSGGQKQRVMIAMAMSNRPSLLICDEPTTALDVTVQKTILELISDLQRTEHMGVIFITHDLGVVAEIADRALVLYKGKVVEEGNVEDLFRRPQHPYTKGLLLCRPALHVKGERLPVVSDFMEGRDLSPRPEAHGLQLTADVLIRVRDLRVWYPSRKSFLGKALAYTKAVDNVSFDIYKGETLGLVGESGCGKTTLGRALLRLIQPTGGTIAFEGRDMATYTSQELKKLRSHIQIVFQDPYSSLNPRITIGAAIAEVLKVHGRAATAAQRRQQTIQLLEKVSLSASHYDRYPHEFSGGQRQRIVIARALALQPSFIVCDESVSALDVSVQAQVLNLLNDLKKEFGFTVVFISHDLSVIRYISDRILVMNKGRIEEIGDAAAVYDHPRSAYTEKLIAAVPRGIASSGEL